MEFNRHIHSEPRLRAVALMTTPLRTLLDDLGLVVEDGTLKGSSAAEATMRGGGLSLVVPRERTPVERDLLARHLIAPWIGVRLEPLPASLETTLTISEV